MKTPASFRLALLVCAVARVSAAIITGDATEVGTDIVHPNGNVYDQVLLRGPTASVRNNAGQITRVAFLDDTDDIVQVEFSGAGMMTVTLPGATAPVAAAKYNQPGVLYMKGHAVITLFSTDATTNLSIFSVGKETALDQSIIRNDVTYDGVADLQLVHIVSNSYHPLGMTFGGIRAGNAHFSSRSGDTGIYAPNVFVQDVVIVGDITALDTAIPKLWFGSASQFGTATIAGGSLDQLSGRPIYGEYLLSLNPQAGRTSAGVVLPRQTIRTRMVYGLPP